MTSATTATKQETAMETTSVENTTLAHLAEAMRSHIQTVAANAAAADAIRTNLGAIALPENHDLVNIEHYMPQRLRARGTFSTANHADFAAYVQQHEDVGATVFIDTTSMSATAVLDLGSADAPGHADNVAVISPVRSAAYTAIISINDRRVTQSDAAEFFEDWKDTAGIEFFDASGANIQPGRAIAALRRLTIDTMRRIESEEQQLSAQLSAFESIQANSKEPLPATIHFTTEPYSGFKARTFVLRLSVIAGDKAPALLLRIKKHAEHQEQIGREFAALIAGEMTDSAIAVLLGRYTKSA